VKMMRKSIIVVISFLMILSLWECLSSLHRDLLFILPAPSKIVTAIWIRYDLFTFHTLATLRVMVLGFLVAFSTAFPLAYAMMHWMPVSLVLQPLFVIVQCIPMFALGPLMVLWFGWSLTAIVMPTALMIFFPLTLSIYKGLLATPTEFLDFFRVNQASAWQTFLKLQLPWALPHIFSGIRISAAIAGIGAIAGEWAGAQKGLGVLMLESRRAADLEMAFGALLCLSVISLALYTLTSTLEKAFQAPKRGKRRFVKGILTLLIMLLLPGCHGYQKHSNEVRLTLDWLPNPNHLPLYVGIEKGFFQDENIKLSILKVRDPADGLPLVATGQVDLTVNYMPQTLRTASRGADVVVVATLVRIPLNCLICRRDSSILTPSDFQGKTIGYSASGVEKAFLDGMMHSQGITLKEKRNVCYDLVTALATRQVDAIYGGYWNIEVPQLQALGVDVNVFKLEDFGVSSYPELIIVGNKQALRNRSYFADRFRRALQKAIDYCCAFPDEAFEVYVKANSNKSAKTLLWEHQAAALTFQTFAREQKVDLDQVQVLKNWLADHGLLSGRVDINELFEGLCVAGS